MSYLNDLNSSRVVESTVATQAEIMEAVEIIFSFSNRNPLIHLVLDETNSRAFICLYKDPLLKISSDVISLSRNYDNDWVPVEGQSQIDVQLSRLGRDSQDSLLH